MSRLPLPPFPDRVDTAQLDWREGTPVSRAFGDVYFSLDGGVAESTHVFVDCNDLPARFAAGGFHAFTIGETGFGTGLNFLVAAQAFLAQAPAGSVLHFVSTEKFPLAPDDLARAQAHWPSLARLAAELRSAMPPAVAGFHHRALCDGRVRLTLLLGDAAALLPRLEAQVDAWFLDGFAPAKNGDLWNDALFGEIARLSAPGATFATFTAAGDVRRGLAAAGFTVGKVPGFGRKRDMLRGHRAASCSEGAMPPIYEKNIGGMAPSLQSAGRRVAIVGGGLAGCAAAREFAGRGWQVTLFERNAQLARETSGNLAGAVYPKFSLHETPQNRWYRDSYLHALARLPQLLGEPDSHAWSRCGLLQLPASDEDDTKLRAIAAAGRWPGDVLRHVDALEAGALCGASMPAGGLWFAGAAWVHPPALCRALAMHANIDVRLQTEVRDITHDGDRPCVDGTSFDAVVIANALAATTFAPATSLPLRRVRGQVTHVRATDASRDLRAVVCHEGYVTPARDDHGDLLHCVGATFAPRDADPSVRNADHEENIGNLAAACPSLHAALGGDACRVTGGRTGFRTQTPDYLPVIGPLAREQDGTISELPGLYVLAALGAKGIAFSLLGAAMIAAQANGEPLPVDREVADALRPARFLWRAQRRRKE